MNKGFVFKFIIFFIICTLLSLSAAFFLGALPEYDPKPTLSSPASLEGKLTVIIDAGHGGEDGGASSAAGLTEKDVNLDIAHLLADMLEANGIDVILTREDDRLLYDRNADYQGKKKRLDFAARLKIIEDNPDAIFISIHMNSFTDPRYSGLQVWYSQNDPSSLRLADIIQKNNKEMLQEQNNRKTKSAGSSIYLLDKAKCPAVLVECGFLSNPEEAARFESNEYKQNVAFVIFCSVMDFLANKG